MRHLRPALAIVLIVGAASIGIVAASDRHAPRTSAPGLRADLLPRGVEGSRAPQIRLSDASGGTVDTASLAGTPYLVSFVYTHCRDVCPIIGQEVGDALRALGPRAPKVRALFVSVDPRHDTPEDARRWLRVHGLPREARYLLGSSRELLPIWRAWFVVPATGAGFDPTSHDAGVWLVDARGRLRGRWSGGDAIAPADVAHDLVRLLETARHA